MQKIKIVEQNQTRIAPTGQSKRINSIALGSSFQRVNNLQTNLDQCLNEIHLEMVSYTCHVAESNRMISVSNLSFDNKLPEYLGLVCRVYIHVLKNFNSNKIYEAMARQLEITPQNIKIRVSLWKAILVLIEKKLIDCLAIPHYTYLTNLMIFRRELTENIFYMVSQQQNCLNIEALIQLNQKLQKNKQMNVFAQQYYYMLGGSYLSISIDTFRTNLMVLAKFIEDYLNGDNVMMQYLKSIDEKKNDKDNQVLQKYIQIVAESRRLNKSSYTEDTMKFAQLLFENNKFIQLNIFAEKIKTPKFKNMFIIFQVLKIQLYFIETSCFKTFLKSTQGEREQKTKSRYYMETLQKLLNKCPYYGDEKCSCKKCQCVRRNRESAKLSQQKKREAIQQIGPLTDKVKQLETKNMELQAENAYLKSLLANFSTHPNFYSIIQQNIQPLNKSLNN